MKKQPVISFRVDTETYRKLETLAKFEFESVGNFAKRQILEFLVANAEAKPDPQELTKEIQSLQRNLSRAVELLARIACRDEPNTRCEAEELVAQWVKREFPR